MPLISVIIPVYKVEKYLKKCVDSILLQTFQDLEIFLVDDGSPDSCGRICDEYAEKDSRIKVIHKENGGLSDARNVALDQINGQYVSFVDSDDWLAPDALEILYTALIKTDADVAVGNMISVYEDGREEELYCPVNEETVLEGEKLLSTLNRPNAPNRLYKAYIFDTLRYPVGKLYEDVFIYHKILSQIKRMVLTGKTTYYYFIRPESIMHMKYNVHFTDIVYAVNDRAEWLDSIGQYRLANETRLFVYSRVAVAEAHLDKSIFEQKEKLNEIRLIYKRCYPSLLRDKSITLKQKMRIICLRLFPRIHTFLWGSKMAITLG